MLNVSADTLFGFDTSEGPSVRAQPPEDPPQLRRVMRSLPARTETVAFAPAIQERVARAAEHLGLRQEPIISGAGHDAQEMARICPTGMIFVPGERDGISHNPRELPTPEQCATGADVLLYVVLDLAGEPEA